MAINLRTLLARYHSCSLFRQLLIPMVAIGAIGIGAIIFSASMLSDSVITLGKMFSTGATRLKTLQSIDKGLSEYRALSLRHQAAESTNVMSKIAADMVAIRHHIETAMPVIDVDVDGSQANLASEGKRLPDAMARYFTDIDTAIQLSADFEKESAFEVLARTEHENLVPIRDAMLAITSYAFDEMTASHKHLVVTANRNLLITSGIGILGGVILLGIAFYISQRISLRLGLLLDWSQRIADGNLHGALTTESGDEIGRLTLGMARMVENLAQGRDALEQARLEAEKTADELRLYANSFESSGEAMLITDHANHIINVNSTFVEQTGYSLNDLYGKDPKLLSSGNTPPEVYAAMWQALDGDGFWQGELWDRKKSGEIYPKLSSISAIRDAEGKVAFYIASFSDISERKANEQRIDYLAHHDALTGLINRYNLENRLGQSLLAAQRENARVAVMFIDMDRFKSINDSLGHHVGDLMLIEVANRLRDSVRDSDIVARLGGDEFVVVLTGMASSLDAAPIADKILRRLGQPYQIENNNLHSTPSIGIAVFPEDGNDGEILMKNADTAMYHAKENGRNNVQFFTAAMNDAAVERLALESDLRQALHEGRLEVHYQPQVFASDGRCCGMEALARWTHPVRGPIAPITFIGIAEESGLIEELGDWVLDAACQQIKMWHEAGFDGIRIAVNISARQLRSPGLVASITDTLRRHGLDGSSLELEITESVAMENPERAIDQLQALRNLGITLAIDDFGTGYSSLAYLKRLPIQVLKLDRTFVRDIESDVNDAEISVATLSLAHNLGLKVVAEGIETPGQRDFLIRNGCDLLQGFLYSRPLPGAAATEFIRSTHGS